MGLEHVALQENAAILKGIDAMAYTHTRLHTCRKPQRHSPSLFSEAGEVPNELLWFVCVCVFS